MIRSEMNLPSLARPWGRWVEEENDATTRAIEAQRADAGSAGSLFAARAENMQHQISALPTVASILTRTPPPQSTTRFLNPNAVAYVYPAQIQSFSAPRPDLAYDFTVIANLVGTGVPTPFSRSLLRLNGIDFMYSHENQKPSEFTTATYSIAGSGSVSPGQSVTVEAAIAAQSTGTMSVSVRLWCIFTGSIVT